jgi:hypothetical protein
VDLLYESVDGVGQSRPHKRDTLYCKRKHRKKCNKVQGVLPAEAASNGARVLVIHFISPFEFRT